MTTRAAWTRVALCALPALLLACTTLGESERADGRALPGDPHSRRLFHTRTLIASLAGSGAHLYFTLHHEHGGSDELWTIPKRGGEAHRLLELDAIHSAPVLDGGYAYFLGEGGELHRVRLDGGEAGVLATAGAIDEAVPPGDARERRHAAYHSRRFSDSNPLPSEVAVDGDFAYWLDDATHAVMKVETTSRVPIALATGLTGASGRLFVDGAHIYLPSARGLMRVATAAPGPAEVLPARTGGNDFVVTAGRVLWKQSERLFELSAAGQPVRTGLPNVPSSSDDMVVLGDTVFYAVRAAGEGSGYVGAQSLQTGAIHKLSNGHLHPNHLVADKDAVYFVELGTTEEIKGELHRDDCCSIWRAER